MKNFLVGILALFSIVGVAADPPSTHGMLIFGTDTIYLSHLPMFHRPHDYQGIFTAKLPADAREVFLTHQKDHPEFPFYTLVPEEFVLPEMAESHAPFKAQIVAGHFERPGHETIVEETMVEFVRTLNFVKLKAATPAATELQYFLFGAPGAFFVAHVIGGKPNFDHVLSAADVPEPVAALVKTSEIVKLTLEGDPKKPARTGVTKAKVGAGTKFPLNLKRSIYTEHGDLQ